MYTISKQFSFSASHQLALSYDSPCNRLHGHNYLVELILSRHGLDTRGMVLDYQEMQPFGTYIAESLDHRHLNDLPEFHEKATTAENLAAHLYAVAKPLFPYTGIAVRVSETPKTWAECNGT